ncbi:MAG TPA: riboflavin biosynthesis protein RibF [Candidatus Krumholzibacterium sp.]|nr:riboflavin biosynthesis protein RibF [Candidatus Krumholzibacterium sp.]
MAEVITAIEAERLRITDSAVSIGVFDGVHTGHQSVIGHLLAERERSGAASSVLITFDRHPLSVTHPERSPRLLTTLDEKISILSATSVDFILVERFDAELARIDYRDFVRENLIRRLGMRSLVIGYDFHLGKGREGNQRNLAQLGSESGFEFSVVPPVVVSGRAVSSTRIRTYIESKKLRRATRLLTRPHFFDAEVVRGMGVGRSIGYPTANLAIADREKLIPPPGVYAVRAETAAGLYGGMMNIGSAPTVRPDGGQSVEVHLFGFRGEIYGEGIRVHCLQWMREERMFGSGDELRRQLACDGEKALRILEKNH